MPRFIRAGMIQTDQHGIRFFGFDALHQAYVVERRLEIISSCASSNPNSVA
jgi:hypothetical protein